MLAEVNGEVAVFVAKPGVGRAKKPFGVTEEVDGEVLLQQSLEEAFDGWVFTEVNEVINVDTNVDRLGCR